MWILIEKGFKKQDINILRTRETRLSLWQEQAGDLQEIDEFAAEAAERRRRGAEWRGSAEIDVGVRRRKLLRISAKTEAGRSATDAADVEAELASRREDQ